MREVIGIEALELSFVASKSLTRSPAVVLGYFVRLVVATLGTAFLGPYALPDGSDQTLVLASPFDDKATDGGLLLARKLGSHSASGTVELGGASRGGR